VGVAITLQNVVSLHPPIDAVLLKSLRMNNIGGYKAEWKKAEKSKWSKFSSEEYDTVIKHTKEVMNEEPLWLIEEHWQGFQ